MVNKSDRAADARRFLRNGEVGKCDPAALSVECDKLVRAETQRSLPAAVALARKFVEFARRRSGMSLETAYRALGWTLHSSGRYGPAEKAYQKARHIARKIPRSRAQIDRILIDVYMYLGDFDESHRRARLAMRAFEKIGAEDELAKTRVNYANLFHRQDRHREASRQYSLAADYFEVHKNDLVLGLACFNRANTQVQLFNFEKARQLYGRASDLFSDLGFDLYVTECQYGRAWIHMLEGNYHVALNDLADCEEKYRAASYAKGIVLCLLDRAEAFLGLNLYADAAVAARDGEMRSRRLDISYEAAKGAFFFAKASFAMGRQKEGRAALRRAVRGFRKERNQGFLAAVELFALQIDTGRTPDYSAFEKSRRLFSKVQLPLWSAINDIQCLSQWPDEKNAMRRLSRNQAVQTVPHLYARWQTLVGDREASQGRPQAAVRHWTQAAEVLDAVRAKLPPLEMRSTFMKERTDPYLRLVNSQVSDNPTRAAAWSERYKTAGIWGATVGEFADDPSRSRAAQSLSALADQVMAIAGRLNRKTGERTAADARASRALTKLQKRVRHDLAAVESPNGTGVDRFEALIEDIRSESFRQPIVQFHYDGDDLISFVHHRGDTRAHRYANGRRLTDEWLGCWRLLLGRNTMARRKHCREDLAEEHRLFGEIGDWLWAPLEVGSRQKRVLVLPEGRISNLPWQAIFYDRTPLASRHSIVISPSLRHHRHARKIRVRSKKIEAFIGSTGGLPNCRKELAALAGKTSDRVAIHDPCRRQHWPDDGSARIWHYAGHAQLRADNPFYSSLSLTDGPLFAADFRLKKCRVWLVTLAACRTGHQSVLPGEESSGLVRSLLEMGARNVVGSHWAVSDESTAFWMNKFYDLILSGQPVGQAVRKAALQVREQYPSAYDWAAFSVFGAG